MHIIINYRREKLQNTTHAALTLMSEDLKPAYKGPEHTNVNNTVSASPDAIELIKHPTALHYPNPV
jgi:hypothetical protein